MPKHPWITTVLAAGAALAFPLAPLAFADGDPPAEAHEEYVAPEAHSESMTRLIHRSIYLGGLSLTAMAVLWSLPAEQSQWYDKPELTGRGLYERWTLNVSKGPVWDGDMRIFNGYGHIHSGAAYTVMCLDEGLTETNCSIYANLVSLAWEYGPEALVEIPSYQDLLMTGLVGARVGVQFHRWKAAIIAKGGTLLGSSVLGGITLFALDPFGSLIDGLQSLFGDESTERSVTSSPFFAPSNGKRGLAVGYAIGSQF